MRLIHLINKIKKLYLSPVDYAKLIGVKVGRNCMIAGKNHWSTEPYLVSIGDNVAITKGVMIHTHGGGRVARVIIPNFDVFGKVVIGNNVYIGSCSQIMPGVTIGDGSLIAAGSIVTKSVKPGIVVGGNPAKYICTVDEFINHNIRFNLGTKQLSYREKRLFLESLSEEKFIKK